MQPRRSHVRSERYIQEAITQLIALKLRSVASTDSIRSFLDECLAKAAQISEGQPQSQGLDIHRLGSILRAWHVEDRYLLDDGSPRPLAVGGRSGLTSLIKEYYPQSKVRMVIDKLMAAKLIRKAGNTTWLPTAKHARIPRLTYETLEHLSEGVARYVETVTKNVTARRSSDVLFERSCKVSRLPVSELDSFRKYVSQQAIAFITAVDDWLESRNVSKHRKGIRVRAAGVYTFAYIDPRK